MQVLSTQQVAWLLTASLQVLPDPEAFAEVIEAKALGSMYPQVPQGLPAMQTPAAAGWHDVKQGSEGVNIASGCLSTSAAKQANAEYSAES